MMTPFERINCCIPGCRRGTRKFGPGTEVICGKCWRLVRKATKRRHRLVEKEWARLEAIDPLPRTSFPTEEIMKGRRRARRMAGLAWRLCIREATEGAAGLR